MAIWKETLEPYIKVTEEIKTSTINPTAGGDLIIGAVIISDSGPGIPTLIKSQKEFLAYYATSEITEEYMASLDSLYDSDPGSSLASTMWLNAYRLAGSTHLLISRAVKGGDIIYTKSLQMGDNHNYIIKDTDVLRQASRFKFVLDPEPSDNDGWIICVSEVGILGNRVTDDGPLYDYDIYNLPDLVDKLNESSKFFSPKYTFYTTPECDPDSKMDEITEDNKNEAVAVVFEEVYLASNFIDTTSETNVLEKKDEEGVVTKVQKTDPTSDTEGGYYGFKGIIPVTPVEGWNETQVALNLSDSEAFAKFETPEYYLTNVYNSNTDLKVRIRRYNHDAVQQKILSDSEQAKGVSPWKVLTTNLDKWTNGGKMKPANTILNKDFYEIGILDPSISDEWQLFNVGNIQGRGDVKLADVNNMLGMMQMHLPDDLFDLGLNYYGYDPDDDGFFVKVEAGGEYDEEAGLYTVTGRKYKVGEFIDSKNTPSKESCNDTYVYIFKDGEDEDTTKWTVYQFLEYGSQEIYQNCKINPKESSLLNVSNSTLMKAWDAIEEEERYIVEGLTDLGCTYTIIQNYVANMAINSNYFYPVSTMNSTNYLTIANFASKITPVSHKLYLLSPWDYDDGTVGFLYNVSPSILYWEVVSRNRANNREFAASFGMMQGIINPVNLAKEFNKSQRQLLLTKKINTIYHDLYNELYYINDNKTREPYSSEYEDIMGEECNARFQIRISKAIPVLLRQFMGRQINQTLYDDIVGVIDYWFKTVIFSYGCTISEYRITCDSTNNTSQDAAAKRVNVRIQVRFYNTLHYCEVLHEAYNVATPFEE